MSIFEKFLAKNKQTNNSNNNSNKSKIEQILERDDISLVKNYNYNPDSKIRYQRSQFDEKSSKFNLWNSIIWMNFFADIIFFVAFIALLFFAAKKVIYTPAEYNSIQQVNFVNSLTRLQYNDIAVALPRALNANSNFFTLNLEEMRQIMLSMPWVKDVKISRVWNGKLIIDITEYSPFAHWGENQNISNNFADNEQQQKQTLIDKNGNSFTIPSDYSVTPKNIPYFYAPDGTEKQLIEYYLKFCEILKPLNLRPIQIYLSPRLSWELRLDNGWLIKLGRDKDNAKSTYKINLTEQRLQRFVNNFDNISKKIKNMGLSNNDFESIDLRYKLGMTIDFK